MKHDYFPGDDYWIPCYSTSTKVYSNFPGPGTYTTEMKPVQTTSGDRTGYTIMTTDREMAYLNDISKLKRRIERLKEENLSYQKDTAEYPMKIRLLHVGDIDK